MHLKKKFLKSIFVLSLFVIPLFIGWIVSFNFVNWLETSNDWIGFWGGYLGGLFTLIGVLITINFSKTDSNEKQRLSVIPYVSIEQNASIDIDENKIPIGLIYAFSESREKNHSLFFDEVKIIGKCRGVGLGPSVNCYINDIKIGERKIDTNTSKVSVLTTSEESYFMLLFLNFGLYPNQLRKEFVNYYNEFWNATSKQPRKPEINIVFNFHFEDVLGHKYKQEVFYIGQLSKPQKNTADRLNILFKSIEKPELI
jgi:putative Mn2+ efflux pump MntP